jgi:glycosyltransferase involved in cell wall biosynthesis
VPARDSAALARSLQTLAEDPERLEAMQEEALRTVKKFGLDQLGKNLRHLESRLPLEKSEDILEL